MSREADARGLANSDVLISFSSIKIDFITVIMWRKITGKDCRKKTYHVFLGRERTDFLRNDEEKREERMEEHGTLRDPVLGRRIREVRQMR